MRRFVYLLFCLIIVATLVEGWYYFFILNAKSADVATPSVNRDISFSPAPVLAFAGDIIYKKSDDQTGRSILYSNQDYPHPGSGEFFFGVQTGPVKLPKIIGILKDWEPISGSKDRYLILEDPAKKTILHKVRVAFQISALFNNGTNTTSLLVENLSTHKVESTGKRMLSLTSDEVNNIFTQSDAVVVYPLLDGKNQMEKDANGEVLAGRLTVRRIGGAKQLGLL